MAYYLMVEKKKGLYQPINIKNSEWYPYPTSRYNKPCAHLLQEIDGFTMLFNDEKELRERLVSERLLSYDLINKPLSIRQPNKDTYVKVPHDFLYQDSIEYVMEPNRLVKFVIDKFYQNDFIFLRKLGNNFSRVHECQVTAPEVAGLAEASLYQGYRRTEFEEIDQNGDLMVARMVKLLVFKHDFEPSGYIRYSSEVNYRNLHGLIAFINNEEKKNCKDIEEQSLIEEEKGSIVNDDKKEIVVSKKLTRKKKNYNLDGQTSFEV